MNLSFQKLFYAIATVFSLFAIFILAKSILIPITFALLIAFILFPLAKKFESWGLNRIISAFLSIFGTILILGGSIFVFSTQIIRISAEFSNFKEKIIRLFADATVYFNSEINFMPNMEQGELFDKLKNWFAESAGSLASQTFNGTAAIIAGLLATVVFTFLFLIYRNGLTYAFTRFYPEEKREQVIKMFKTVQQVGQKYLFGMILIMIILGLINSIGLWMIGIDNPFLFGFLAAVLAIIPYVGTTLGAAIPVLYAVISYDNIWIAISVAILFWAVQIVESNFLTPKIVGGSMRINALAAILSIFIGASVWGIAGMILFLPLTAMLKVICDEYTELKPIALLIGDYSDEKESGFKFFNKWIEKIRNSSSNFVNQQKKNK